jgi:hypothetical protein
LEFDQSSARAAVVPMSVVDAMLLLEIMPRAVTAPRTLRRFIAIVLWKVRKRMKQDQLTCKIDASAQTDAEIDS